MAQEGEAVKLEFSTGGDVTGSVSMNLA